MDEALPNLPSVVSIVDIPGYKEAEAAQDKMRLLAFFDDGFTVCGFKVVPLTFRKLLALELIKSPFLNGSIPSPKELEDFLWCMSPDFARIEKRRKHHRRCVKVFHPTTRRFYMPRNWWAMREARKTQAVSFTVARILHSMEQDFMDAPRNLGGNGSQKSYYHSAVAVIARLPRFSMDEVLDMPLGLLFQFLRHQRQSDAVKAASDKGVEFHSPLSNPSDAVVMDFCKKQAEKVRAAS